MADSKAVAAALSDEILQNIELREITLDAVMLKCARLARLLKDDQHLKLFQYESGGYPTTPDSIPSHVF
ncbi:hypothetical protein, partial [Novosphingobium sp.]|uniref:AbiTii domain-containing protein n=1 Tax=Novosphingobium sp. TaxID=1874826 RepID=UPI00286E7F9A